MLSQKFVANKETISRLEGFLSCDRLPHAILFCGESGVGKTHLANLFAMGIVCKSEHDKPCGLCSSCKKALAGVHTDINFIGGSERLSSLKKNEIDAFRKMLYLEPNESMRKVFIIDNASDLTIQAENSLLKALEEPPADTVILLTARNRNDLLPTVRSRVIEFTLQPPSPEQAVPFIMQETGCDAPTSQAIAKRYNGNIGRAVSYLTQPEQKEAEDTIDTLLAAIQGGTYKITVALVALQQQKKERRELVQLLTLLYERLCDLLHTDTTYTKFDTMADQCEAVQMAIDSLNSNAPVATVLVWLGGVLK